ncbi:MAG: hypothetical protein ACJ789_03090 [Thermomicrobiales bacterium]
MNAIRQFLQRPFRARSTRFDRYYGGLLRPGAGYPTADEARRDLKEFHRSTYFDGWLR